MQGTSGGMVTYRIKINLQDDSPENPFKTLQHQHIPVTPMSTVPSTLFSPSAISQAFDLSMTSQYDEEPSTSTPQGKLNCFIAARDVSPIRTSMMTPSEETAGRSKRHYLRKARQVVFAILEEIAHNNSERLFRAIKERQLYEKMTGIACCQKL